MVLVAFCSLVAVGVGLDHLRRRIGLHRTSGVIVVVVILGLVGTNPAFLISDHDVTAASWASDRALVAEVELVFGSVAQVFQLPIVPFPEHPPVNRMVDYDHLRGYLHSDSLGWS